MDVPTFDFADARNRMVDSQVRPNKVTDPRIIAAMREIPRELFVPPSLLKVAYIDRDIPLGRGRMLIEPMVIARLIQLLAVDEGDRVLVIGAGSGYGAAIVSACGARVTALEEERELIELGQGALNQLAPHVSVVTGPLEAGWPTNAPYDSILIEGAVETIPQELGGQLKADSGRLVAVVKPGPGVGQAVLAEPTPLGLRAQPMFDCATPVIPAFRTKPGFVF